LLSATLFIRAEGSSHRSDPGNGIEDGVGPTEANMQSLNMLVATEGKERSRGEYTRLPRAAGFGEVDRRRTSSTLDAVLAVKD